MAAGLYREPAEVIGVALGLLEQRQREYEQLRPAIEQFDRGEYSTLDIDDVKRRGRGRRAQQ